MGHVKANCPWGFPAVFFYLGAQLSQNLPLLRKTSLGSDSGREGNPAPPQCHKSEHPLLC